MTNIEIIGLVGVAGSGKDYQADILVKEHGFVKLPFAFALKNLVTKIFNIDAFDEDFKSFSLDLREEDELQIQRLTGRQILQNVGVAMRDIDPDFWIKEWFRKADELTRMGHRKIVVPDVRFPNEILHIKETCKGTLLFTDYHSDRYDTAGSHSSEKLARVFRDVIYKDCVNEYVREIGIYELYTALYFYGRND